MKDLTREQHSIGELATLACLLEVTAPKPGNVHRGADFEDVSFEDFVLSAWTIAPAMNRAASQGVGQIVYESIAATRRLVNTNTNLGIALLLAPLAAAAAKYPTGDLAAGVARVLAELNAEDSKQVYAAIRLAVPGGLGETAEHDVVRDEAPADLLTAMQSAAERDRIARQYVTGFENIFQTALPLLKSELLRCGDLQTAVIATHVGLMSRWPDSLIARKCGSLVATQSQMRAMKVVDSGEPKSASWWHEIAELDFWLRSDGHRRNPGTTADLICATIFAGWLNHSLPLTPWTHQ